VIQIVCHGLPLVDLRIHKLMLAVIIRRKVNQRGGRVVYARNLTRFDFTWG